MNNQVMVSPTAPPRGSKRTCEVTCRPSNNGGSNVTDKYMKYLNKKTVVELKNIAKNKNIKITTKKEGKIVYLKKSAIIKKLCDLKHPKKVAKKVTKK